MSVHGMVGGTRPADAPSWKHQLVLFLPVSRVLCGSLWIYVRQVEVEACFFVNAFRVFAMKGSKQSRIVA